MKNSKRILSVRVREIIDTEPDTSYLEQKGFERRLQEYQRGKFCYIGIRAEALVQLTGELTQRISSGGLYGIESDSDKSYLAEVQRDELSNLKAELQAIGFGTRAISKAFKSIQEREG